MKNNFIPGDIFPLAPLSPRIADCCRKLADWLCLVQEPHADDRADAGRIAFLVYGNGREYRACGWLNAYAALALTSAGRYFGEEKYIFAAGNIFRYLKTLQIFSPFAGVHSGAIREATPLTPWCYTRDALSVAWAFLVNYEITVSEEYLTRARLWAQWFLKNGMDDMGWPLWGVELEPLFVTKNSCDNPVMRTDIHGAFQGGCLTFLVRLSGLDTSRNWIETAVRIGDYLTAVVQQPEGFFSPIDKKTGKPPEGKDPQGGLHTFNDDFAALGLLALYRKTGNKKYLSAVQKFIDWALRLQKKNGTFEESIACIPVIYNTVYEGGDELDIPKNISSLVHDAFTSLMNRQSAGLTNSRMTGGLVEYAGQDFVCSRSACYTLLFFLKLLGGLNLLSAGPVVSGNNK